MRPRACAALPQGGISGRRSYGLRPFPRWRRLLRCNLRRASCLLGDDPARIPLEREAFDLIWVGSLFTHFDAERWPGFLNALRSFLRPRGVLVFTTHGRAAWHLLTTSSDVEWHIPYYRVTSLLHDYRRTGFGYGRYTWSNNDGVSLSTADWVLRQLEAIDELRLVYCGERAWSNFHDVFALIREPDWHVRQPPIPTWR